MRSTTPSILWSSVAITLAALATPVHAQGTAGSGTTAREVQRGVPGVDVDLNTRGRPATNGVPGVDVDLGNPRRNNGVPGVDVDTRTSGAGAARNTDVGGQRAARADRN